MAESEEVMKQVLAALEQEPRMGLHQRPVAIEFSDGVLTVSGEVDDVAAKKLGLELAGAVPGVSGIVDRLRITPAEPMEDGAIRDHLCDALIAEPVFTEYSIRTVVKGENEIIREVPRDAAGVIELEVQEGVVTLNGRAGSLSHKRLAGVLAWWVPGSRDVVNGLEVFPFMDDHEDEVVDAVRLVLEKDPFVNASQIRVGCRGHVVTLAGQVPKKEQKHMAEADAWYVFRVDKVVNNIIVAE